MLVKEVDMVNIIMDMETGKMEMDDGYRDSK